MKQFLQDLRFTFRMIRKRPVFFLVVILTLTLGIGANTTIFSLVNGVVLKPLSYKDSERIVVLFEERRADRAQTWCRVANFLDWQDQNNVFEYLGYFQPNRFIFSNEGVPETIGGARTSANFFDVLGAEAFLGRVFQPEDEQPGAEPVAVLSYELWSTLFGGDRSWLGRTVNLDSRPHTIVGVMPPDFEFSLRRDQKIWTPKVFTEEERANRERARILAVGRLNAGISITEAQADMDRITQRLEELYPREDETWGVWISPLKDRIVSDADFALLVMLGCVTVVLLIACANVVNLLLAHTTMRERELALRVAMGAGRGRLIRHFLTECLVLSILGALGGLIFVVLITKGLVLLDPGSIPRLDEVGIDTRVLAFTLGILLLVTMVLGLVTSFKFFRMSLVENIKKGVISTKEVGVFKVRNLFVVMEVGLVLSLLVFGALMLESYRRLSEVDPGFATEGRFTFEVNLPLEKYPDERAVVPFFNELLEKLNALPGIEASSVSTNIPLSGRMYASNYMIAGDMSTAGARQPQGAFDYVTVGYFRTMGIPLLAGRNFTEADRVGAPKVTILNQTMAEKHWTVDDAVGKYLYIEGEKFEIIGVVGDAKYASVSETRWMPKFYRPHRQSDYPFPNRQVIVWTRMENPEDLIPSIRNAVLGIDSDQPINNVRLLEDMVHDSNARHRFNMISFLIFGLIGLFLGAVGVYGVASYSVGRRIREMGIRMAFGARRSDVLRLVLGSELIPVTVGLALGIAASLVLSQAMSKLLYGVSTSDPVFYAGVSCVLLVVATMAILIPAFRASRVDPLSSIRYE